MNDLPAFKKAWALLDRRERRNAGVVLLVVITAALSSAIMVGSIFPFLAVLAEPSNIQTIPQLKWVYETFGFTTQYGFLVALGVGTLTIILLFNALQLSRTYVILRYCMMRTHVLSRKLLGLYLNQPYEFFFNRHSSDMSTRVLSEVEQAVNQFFIPFAEIVASSLTVLMLVLLLIWVNPAVAIGAFAALGSTYGLLYLFVRRRLSQLGTQRVEANQKRFLTAKEVLGGIKEVKLHGNEEAYFDRFDAASFRTINTRLISQLISQLPNYIMQALVMGGLVFFCILMLDPAAFETGESALVGFLPLIGTIAFAGQRMMPEVSRLYKCVTKMRSGVAALDVVYSDFQAAVSTPKATVGQTIEPLGLRSELRLDAVTYGYPKSDKPSLESLSLSIKAGERIGIVGGTGAGKTTLADIALGLLSPAEGHVLADGIEITEDNKRRWQRSVGYVPQDIFLTDSTILENIAFGVPKQEIDRDRIETVARIAQLDTFVTQELPNGYDTKTGERGVRLSGGQRQRIGIARALYRGSDLIVFDEATSALDNVTEREVMSAIEAIPENKTILMIAHRLSTVKSCDRIIVLQKGRIVGLGPWDDLIAHNPSFQKLTDAAA
ncbi:MAG: ABC transporter ATP-binding protein [Pseudomonadota bacterium]